MSYHPNKLGQLGPTETFPLSGASFWMWSGQTLERRCLYMQAFIIIIMLSMWTSGRTGLALSCQYNSDF